MSQNKRKNTVFTEFCTKIIVKNEKNVISTTNEQIKTVYSNWKIRKNHKKLVKNQPCKAVSKKR